MVSEHLHPLESNPEVMNKLLQKIGVPNSWEIVDVMGLEQEMLWCVPQPAVAVILLFPGTEAYEKHKKQEETEILSKGQEVSSNLFYMKQNIYNTCGTVALVHGIANNTDTIKLSEGHLKNFLDEAKPLDAVKRGKLLESHEGIVKAHKELAEEGQTKPPNPEDPVIHHFIAFVHKDGALYELDGNKAFPINHGPTTADSFLEDASKVCKEFMARDPENFNFTVVALAASD